MTMKKKSPNQPPVLNVPVAIIIAGALIAGSLYLSGINTGSSDTAVQGDTAQPPAAQPQAQAPTIGDIREVTDEDHTKGASNPKVTIIEYSDVQCSFCKRFHPTMKRLVEEYPNDVQWVYRHFVLGRFPGSEEIALATECAAEQGKFWEVTDVVMDVNKQVQLSELSSIARSAGVSNMTQFDNCMETKKYADKVTSDTEDARLAGGRGTPYSVVIGPNGDKLPLSGAQPYDAVKKMVDGLLE